MGFSDTLKEVMDLGVAASKDFAAKAGVKAQDIGSKGLKATGEFASKAGAKLQELGEKGALSVDIKQMENQTKKLLGLLGAELFRRYEQGMPISAEEPEIKGVLEELVSLKETIEKKEEELKMVGKLVKPEE